MQVFGSILGVPEKKVQAMMGATTSIKAQSSTPEGISYVEMHRRTLSNVCPPCAVMLGSTANE